MPVDPNIPLEIGRPAGYGLPLAQDMQAVYAAQNQQYKSYLQNQDIAGQNALRSVLSDPSNLNPATGLPNAAALSPVAGVNPQMYMDFLLATQKGQEQQERSNLANFAVTQKYNATFKEEVGKPLVDFEQELQRQNLEPEQRQIMIEQKRKALTDAWQNRNGAPSKIRAAVDRPYDETWPIRNELHDQRVEQIEKGWDKDQYTDNTGTTFRLNKFMGGYWNIDSMTPYHPVGAVHKVGAEPKEAAPNLVDVTPQGNVYGVTWDPVAKTYVKDGAPYTPTNLQQIGKASEREPKPLVTENIKIKKPDGSTEVIAAQELPSQPGQPANYQNLQGKRIDPSTIVQTKIPASTVDQPEYSPTAVNVLVQEAMTGDKSALAGAWGASGQRLRAQVVNGLADKALEQWGEFARVKGTDGKINKVEVKRDPDNPEQYLDTNGNKIDPSTIVESKIPSPEAGENLAALHAMFSSREGALRGLTKLQGNVENYERTALGEAKIALDLASKGLAETGIPLINRWIQAGRTGVAGDADVSALNAAVVSLANEYAKVMSSPGATGAVTSDAARAEAQGIINKAQTPAQFQGVIDTMERSMTNRVGKIKDQIGSTVNDIKTGGGVTAPATELPSPLSQPATPSSGAATIPGAAPRSSSASGATPVAPQFPTQDSLKAQLKAKPGNGPWRIQNHTTGKVEIWTRDPSGEPRQTGTE